MLAPAIPINEERRLQALVSLNLLDTAPEERFDRIARLAQASFGASIAAISLVDRNRQWFKSIVGLNTQQTSRAVSFCGHTVLQDGCFVVKDARQDNRFADNPLVTGQPNIRFYAGWPIHSGIHRIGSLCVINQFRLTFNGRDMARLSELTAMVEEEIRAGSRATSI